MIIFFTFHKEICDFPKISRNSIVIEIVQTSISIEMVIVTEPKSLIRTVRV